MFFHDKLPLQTTKLKPPLFLFERYSDPIYLQIILHRDVFQKLHSLRVIPVFLLQKNTGYCIYEEIFDLRLTFTINDKINLLLYQKISVF